MKPLLLLDVDGVINAKSTLRLPSGKGVLAQWDDLTSFRCPTILDDGRVSSLSTNTSLTVVRFIEKLSLLVEVRWFSDWFADTAVLGQQLGLPSFPFEGNEEDVTDITNEWWKLSFLRQNFLDREIIWVDDCLDELGVTEFVAAQNGRIRTVQPNPRTGLTQQDLKTLEEMVTSR